MEDEVEDITNYSGLEGQIREKLSQNAKNRFVPMEERQDTSVLSVDVLRNLCQGKTCVNGSFPSALVPLFQSESKCGTILVKMTLICTKMNLHAELIFVRMVSHLHSF